MTIFKVPRIVDREPLPPDVGTKERIGLMILAVIVALAVLCVVLAFSAWILQAGG